MKKVTVTIALNEKILDVLGHFKVRQIAMLGRLADKESDLVLKDHWLTQVKEYEAADYEFLAGEYMFDCAVRELRERGELNG